MVLSGLTVKVSSELLPAKLSTMRPAWSKTHAKGTGAAGFSTGAADGRPSSPIENTSTVLLVLVVTIRCSPSGVKPTCAGELKKNGGGAVAQPRARGGPATGSTRPPPTRAP